MGGRGKKGVKRRPEEDEEDPYAAFRARQAANNAEIQARREADTQAAIRNAEAANRMMFGPGGASPRGVNAENAQTFIDGAQKALERAQADADNKNYTPSYRRNAKQRVADQKRIIAAIQKKFPKRGR
jgi:hypothetical protein